MTVADVAESNTLRGAGRRVLFLDSRSSIDAQAFHGALKNDITRHQYADRLLVGIVDVDSMEREDNRKMREVLDSLRRSSDRLDAGGVLPPHGGARSIHFENGDAIGTARCAAIGSLKRFREINRVAFSKISIAVDASSVQK